MPSLIKNWKVLLWILFIIGSFAAIGFRPGAEGSIIVGKSTDSPVPLANGDILYFINSERPDADTLNRFYEGLVTINSNKGEKIFAVNGTLGITTRPVPNSNLRFGLDIEGGVRTILTLNDSDNLTAEQTLSTLQTRINLYGLREANMRIIRESGATLIEISIAGGTVEEISQLLERQGNFEAKIPLLLPTDDDRSQVELDAVYLIDVLNNSISAQNQKINLGDSFTLGTTKLKLNAIERTRLNLTALVFDSSDISFVYFDPQRSGIQPQDNGFEWSFQVRLSSAGAERFSQVTKNLQPVFGTGGGYLSQPLELYLDNEFIDALSIASDLRGRVVNEPSVSGFSADQKTAADSMRRLQTILRSGALPTKVEIAQKESISPKLGSGFIGNIVFALVAALAAVSVVITLRYRKPKIIIPTLITAFSEVLILFGASVAIGWTIDLASVAAILAIVGTGIDAQIVIIDHTIHGGEAELSLAERIKRAIFIIFGSGGTVIGAMVPLLGLGLGVLRGFAITTIVGVLIGIFITRPAFSEIMKRIATPKHQI